MLRGQRKELGKDASDAEIWEQFRQGNEFAFDFMYQKYFDKLYSYGLQFTRDKTLVEDAIQELFIDLRRRRKYLSSTDHILPYLYTGFKRKIIRLRQKSEKLQQAGKVELFPITLPIEDEIISEELKKESITRLRQSMAGLSEKHREIIYYFYYENMSYLEIQQVLGFENVKSVRNLLYKALNSLKKSMLSAIVFLQVALSFLAK